MANSVSLPGLVPEGKALVDGRKLPCGDHLGQYGTRATVPAVEAIGRVLTELEAYHAEHILPQNPLSAELG